MTAILEKATICEFPISTGTLDDHYKIIVNNIKEKKGRWIVTLNLEMIYLSQKQKTYKKLLDAADLFIADGVPLIWASKFKKNVAVISGRSNGTDLVEKLLVSASNLRIGVIGGINPAMAIENCNPNLLPNAYVFDGALDLNDKKTLNEIIENLHRLKIDLLFLNLGIPKQDVLADQIRQQHAGVTIIGVGGSFDLLAGLKSRAPKWMQRNGLEWFHRLLTEPKRLSKRYLVNYPQAIYFLVKDLL